MPVTQAAGILYVLAALVSGYWEFNLLLRPLIGGPSSWWYPVTLASSLVLLIGGILTLASHMKNAWLVVLVASLVLASWWLPASAHTLRVYFSPRPPTPNPSELFWALVPAALVIGCIAVVALSRSLATGNRT